jgi:hypothetical protein
MSEKKEMLLNLILKQNVSAIVTLSEKTQSEPDEIIKMLSELVNEGKLHGSVSEDGTRFFKNDARVSEAPVIHRDDKEPEFLSYNTRPGYITAIIGALILAGSVVVNINSTDLIEQNFAAVLFLVGIVILFVGLYFVARRKTPS